MNEKESSDVKPDAMPIGGPEFSNVIESAKDRTHTNEIGPRE